MVVALALATGLWSQEQSRSLRAWRLFRTWLACARNYDSNKEMALQKKTFQGPKSYFSKYVSPPPLKNRKHVQYIIRTEPKPNRSQYMSAINIEQVSQHA